jgi:hypothetical protein
VVQVAGTNVSIEDVVRCLRSVEGVAQASARLDGGRIKALIVPVDPEGDIAALEDALRARTLFLEAPARPDRYSFAACIPRSAIGKPVDW